jgi:hypothetical protein
MKWVISVVILDSMATAIRTWDGHHICMPAQEQDSVSDRAAQHNVQTGHLRQTAPPPVHRCSSECARGSSCRRAHTRHSPHQEAGPGGSLFLVCRIVQLYVLSLLSPDPARGLAAEGPGRAV